MGRTDTGNIIFEGNTIANDFKIDITSSPGYTFNSYLDEINQKIINNSDNGNINTTNTLVTVENSFTQIKVDINKRFREKCIHTGFNRNFIYKRLVKVYEWK